LIIGLIGGIASGKSSAAKALESWGAHVIDADKLGHSAYLKGSPAFHAVVDTFGADTVGEDGEIDRRSLGAKVFGNPDKLKALTDIVWPAIRALAAAEIKSLQTQYANAVIVLEAAVLIEAGWQDLVDEIWVVSVDRDTAIARACARDNVEPSAVQARIDAQLSNEERLRHAQQVIDNTGSQEQLLVQLKSLWAQIGATNT